MAFSSRLRDSAIVPSMGAVGAAGDNAMMASFWARLQVEVLSHRRWKTRIELATAIHDYIQFHNNQRRHSALGMRTPSEIETAWTNNGQHGCCRPPDSCSDRPNEGGCSRRPCWSRWDLRRSRPDRPSTSTSQQQPSRLTSNLRLHRNRGRSQSPCNPVRLSCLATSSPTGPSTPSSTPQACPSPPSFSNVATTGLIPPD